MEQDNLYPLDEPYPRRRQTLFIIITLAWLAVLSLALGYIAFSALRLWAVAQNSMVQAAYDLDTLAKSRITYTLYIDQMFDVDVAVPFRQEFTVPVDLEVDQEFPFNATVPFQDELVVPIDQVIYVSETVSIPLEIPGAADPVDLPVPIQAEIPINLEVNVPLNKEVEVQTTLPVRFPVSETFTIFISHTLPIQTQVPVVLDLPIAIGLEETPLADYLRTLSGALRRVSEGGP
jgi:hypothetical protein